MTGLLFLASLPFAGCLNAQTYGTPRTLPAGRVQGFVAIEALGVTRKFDRAAVDENNEPATDEDGNSLFVRKRSAVAVLPTLPTVGLRVGLVRDVDVGFRLAGTLSPQADIKYNFLRTKPFDMAVAPSFQYFNAVISSVYFPQLPILMGFNLSGNSTLLFNLGGAYLYVPGSTVTISSEGKPKNAQSIASVSTPFARAGLGFNYRFRTNGRGASLTPEVSALYGFDEGKTIIFNFGLSVSFGSQPVYTTGASDDWSEDEGIDRPQAADRSVGKTDIEDEVGPVKTKAPKLKVEQDPYEVEKERKLAEEKKAAEEAEKKRLEDEEKAAEEKKKKKKKK